MSATGPTKQQPSSYVRRSNRARWFWDSAGRVRTRPGSWLDQQQHRQAQLAVRTLSLSAGEVVLDVGCGAGAAFPEVRSAVGERGRVVGIDISPRMLAAAQATVAAHGWVNVDVREGEASATTLESDAYDAAIALYSLSTVPDLVAAVDRLCQALRPGGRVFVGDMCFGPHPAAHLLRTLYRCVTGANADDIRAALEARFDAVEPVIDGRGRPLALPPGRSWPPITYLLARKS